MRRKRIVVDTVIGPIHLQRDPSLPALAELPDDVPKDLSDRMEQAVIEVLTQHVKEEAKQPADPRAERASAHGD